MHLADHLSAIALRKPVSPGPKDVLLNGWIPHVVSRSYTCIPVHDVSVESGNVTLRKLYAFLIMTGASV